MTTDEVVGGLKFMNESLKYFDGVGTYVLEEAMKKLERGKKKAREAKHWKRKYLELKSKREKLDE